MKNSKSKNEKDYNMFVSAHIDGDNKQWEIEINDYFPVLAKNPIPFATVDKLLERHSFLDYKNKIQTVRFKQGEWVIKSPLIIPPDITLIIPKGTK